MDRKEIIVVRMTTHFFMNMLNIFLNDLLRESQFLFISTTFICGQQFMHEAV